MPLLILEGFNFYLIPEGFHFLLIPRECNQCILELQNLFVSHLHPAARQFCRSTYTITDNTIK
jgi:hypothetical protein